MLQLERAGEAVSCSDPRRAWLKCSQWCSQASARANGRSSSRSGPTGPTGPDVLASAPLQPEGTVVAARGLIEMSGAGDDQVMTVKTAELPPAPAGSFYEVWLLQPGSGQMLAVGVLPGSGTGSYALPADILGRYQAVDISLQPDNGVITHSGDSVLRAEYA